MKERFWQKCFPVNLAQNFKHNFFTEHHSAATISLETYSDLFILYSTKIVKIQEVLYIKRIDISFSREHVLLIVSYSI